MVARPCDTDTGYSAGEHAGTTPKGRADMGIYLTKVVETGDRAVILAESGMHGASMVRETGAILAKMRVAHVVTA